MGIHLEHSSSGFGAFYIEPGELPETEWPLTEAAPGPAPAAVEAPAPAPSTWLEDLPPAHFGPTAPSVVEPSISTLLAALPTAPVPLDTDPTPASPSATETEQTPQQPRADNPGDRTSDFDLIAHHERFIARSEAAWSAMSEAYQRARDAEAERPHSGDETYARERAVEYQQMMLRAEEERQASEALPTAAGPDPGSDNQSAAESERLARQNETLAVAATTQSAWAGGPDQAVRGQPATAATSGQISTPNPPTTQVVVIVGRRPPPGAAVDVTLPAGVEDAEDITRPGTPTQLLTGSAATAALTSLGVLAIDAESTTMSAAGRAVLYLGERVVGYAVPGGQVLLAVTTAYDLIHSGTQQAPGAAFVNADGLVQRYAPADDGGLVLQTQAPQPYDALISPEEDHTWVSVGRVTPMSEEERAQMLRPTTTPGTPLPPTPPVINVPPQVDLRTPGSEGDGNANTSTPPLVADPQGWEELVLDIVGVEDANHGNVPFRSDFDQHLAMPDPGKSSAGGLLPSGGHNAYEAMDWLEARGIPYELRGTGTPGIDTIVVRNPNAAGGESTKTVYDPAYYSDTQMAALARIAGQQVFEAQLNAGTLTAPTKALVTVEGITFMVYINPEKGTNRLIVGNAHPI